MHITTQADIRFARPASRSGGPGRWWTSLRIGAALFMAALSCPAMAQSPSVASALTVSRVITAPDGSEQLVPADLVKPGDVLLYNATYTNRGAVGVRELTASLPIPTGTELTDTATLPRDVKASLDGKLYAAIPLTRKVRLADGRTAEERVPLSEYRFLRWPEHQLLPAATFTTGARVRVVSASPSIR